MSRIQVSGRWVDLKEHPKVECFAGNKGDKVLYYYHRQRMLQLALPGRMLMVQNKIERLNQQLAQGEVAKQKDIEKKIKVVEELLFEQKKHKCILKQQIDLRLFKNNPKNATNEDAKEYFKILCRRALEPLKDIYEQQVSSLTFFVVQ